MDVFFLFCSCTNGGGEEDCDEDVKEEAQKPTSCGMITDPNGWFTHTNAHKPKHTHTHVRGGQVTKQKFKIRNILDFIGFYIM